MKRPLLIVFNNSLPLRVNNVSMIFYFKISVCIIERGNSIAHLMDLVLRISFKSDTGNYSKLHENINKPTSCFKIA